jgi:hypothetical protein
MDLTEHLDFPSLSIDLGGKSYSFGELPLESLARLQQWIRANCLHPIDAIKAHLDGLPDTDRQRLLESARVEARTWPPQIGTQAGALALLGSEAGQVEALYEGLLVHQPAITRPQALRVFRQLGKNLAKGDGEKTIQRIFAVMFGLGDPDDDRPKG